MSTTVLKKRLPLFVFLLVCSLCFANPFTGNKDSPSPVRQSQPSGSLVRRQSKLHKKLGDCIAAWKEHGAAGSLVSILTLAFLYGVIHAAGPGHRKTVIFSFYLTRSAKAIEPFLTGLALAGMHGGAAIILMLIFKGVSGAISVRTNDASIYMEGISFIILILLSLYSIAHVFIELKQKKDDNCKDEKLKLSAILLSGIYPCPAALLVLILTVTLDILPLGISAVIAMSAGMSIPITVAGYFAWAGRFGIFNKLKANERVASIVSAILELSGYCFLLGLSLYATMPFIISIIRRSI